jgi:hypothetical protein
MGEERDNLIRRLGEVPRVDRDLPDAQLVKEAYRTYEAQGRLPPEVLSARRRSVEEGHRPGLLVGYGTLLSRASVATTLGPEAETKPAIPVVVEGYRRLFNLRPTHYEPSYRRTPEPLEVGAMNVQRAPGFRFNGLAFSVSLRDLEALDERERYYERIWAPAERFPDGKALGEAFVYSAAPGSSWVEEDPALIQPHWRDIVLARGGAYAVGRSFGELFDATTYLADGKTLVVDAMGGELPSPEKG